MTRRIIGSALAASVLLFGTLLVLATPALSEAEVVIFHEDFDDDLDLAWHMDDHNEGSGKDYWGVSAYRYHLGGSSAWCAQVGINSEETMPPWLNYQLHRYDNDMQAVMQIPLPDMSGYDSVTLSFYYWAKTGETNLYDYLEVRVWDGVSWVRLWKQPGVDSGGWLRVELEIPRYTVWLSFSFISNEAVQYEGAYVDTVTVSGMDSTPPVSDLLDLDGYHSSELVFIRYTAVDRGGSGIHHVELYYRMGGEGGYALYITPDVPEGRWTDALVPFNCSLAGGYGSYEFYMVAEDNAGNREESPGEPGASIVFDRQPPTTAASSASGTIPRGWTNVPVSLELEAADDISGVAATMYRVDDGPWCGYDEPIVVDEDGEHSVSFYSEDRAGNREAVTTFEFGIDTGAPTAHLWTQGNLTHFTDATVSLGWTSDDGLSGIDHCLFRVDGRAFEFFSGHTGTADVPRLSTGEHTATLRAYDRAGNYVEETVVFHVDLGDEEDETEPDKDGIGPGWWVAMAVMVAAVAAVAAVVLLNRK